MRIAVLYTGGTVGCVGEPLAPLGDARFRAAFDAVVTPALRRQFPDLEIGHVPFGAEHDSTNLQPRDWCKMAGDLLLVYDDWEAFLVLHGTDTMAFSAAALSFLLTGLGADGFPDAVLSKPVVVTGSQRPLFQEDAAGGLSLGFNTDAWQNVCGALAAAHSGVPEVCVYFQDTLFRGNRVTKTHATLFDAFSSPNYPPLGQAGVEFFLDKQAILHLPTTPAISLDSPDARRSLIEQLEHVAARVDASRVLPFLAYPAPYDDRATPTSSVLADMLDACVDQGVKGLLLMSYGEGNFPSGSPHDPAAGAVYRALRAANERGVVLMDCSQVLAGIVDSTAYASGSWLSEVGAVGTYDMTSAATLAKLVWLLALRNHGGRDWSLADIKRLMQTNLTGEIMDIHRLDSRGKVFLAANESIEALDGSAVLRVEPDRGPVLRDARGTELWAALTDPDAADLPGRLYMQGDGNLVFYDSSNTVRWSSDTARTAHAASMLILEGASAPDGITLRLWNYARGRVVRTLYPGS